MKIVDGESNLFHVVGALHPSCGFTCGLNGGQEQGNQNANDGDNNKKFDKRKSKKITSLAPPPLI